jgi:hypothetical protein
MERIKVAKRIAELEKLLNRDKAISADELRTRARAEPKDEGDLFGEEEAKYSERERPERRVTPEGFVDDGYGGVDYGEIPEDVAQAVQRPSGPIRLTDERRNHILTDHPDLVSQGYSDAATFAHDVARNYSAVYRGAGGSLLLVRRNGQPKMAAVRLVPAPSGKYWSVHTAFLITTAGLKRRERRGDLLWEGNRGTRSERSGATSDIPNRPGVEDESSRRLPDDQRLDGPQQDPPSKVSEDEPRYEGQSREQTQSPAFRRWFKDSRVVDADGAPLVVYHGTPNADFDTFSEQGEYGGQLGYWFTESTREADGYAQTEQSRATLPRTSGAGGPGVHDAYLSLQNPRVYASWHALSQAITSAASATVNPVRPTATGPYARTANGPFVSTNDAARALRLQLERQGHDGIIVEGGEGNGDHFAAFRPAQIKSATKNSGAFDPENPSMLREDEPRYGAGTEEERKAAYDRIVAMRERGMTLQQIADAEGVTRQAISLRLKAGVPQPSGRPRKHPNAAEVDAEQGRRVRAARAAGRTIAQIADFEGISETAVWTLIANDPGTLREDEPPYGGEATPEEEEPAFGVKNAKSAETREALGMPPRELPEPRTHKEMYAAGKALDTRDPNAIHALLDQLYADPERIVGTREEAGLLLKHRVDLERTLRRLLREADDAAAAGDEAAEKEAREQLHIHRESIARFTELVERTGTATGRALEARKMMSAIDYSLVSMEAEAADARGRALTQAELAEVRKKYEDIQAKLAATEADAAAARERAAEAEADLHHAKLRAEAMQPVMTRVAKRLEGPAAAARARIKARGHRALAGLDPAELADYAILGAEQLANGAVRFAEWSKGMLAEFGDYVEPHLRDIFERSNEMLNAALKKERARAEPKEKAPKEPKEPKPRAPRASRPRAEPMDELEDEEAEATSVFDKMQKRVQGGVEDPAELRPYLRTLALEEINNGITEREPLLTRLHGYMEELFPGITRTEVRDILSGYGVFTPLDMSADKVRLREINAEAQKLAQLEALERKEAPLATGFERQAPSEEARRLQKQVNEAKKKAGFLKGQDDASRLRSALSAAKTRTENLIRDLQTEIDTGRRIVAAKSVLIADAELAALRAELARVREAHAAVFVKPGMTDAQRLALATRFAEGTAKAWEERLAQARAGVFTTPAAPRRLTSPELDALRAQAKAAREEFRALELLDPAHAARAEERENQLYRANIARREADLRDRMARGEYLPKPKIGRHLDAESLRIQAAYETSKRKWREWVRQKKLENRTRGEKVRDALFAIPGTAKSIVASLDDSALLRQGLPTLLTHPRTWFRNSLTSFVDIAQTVAGKEVMDAVRADIDNRPNSGLYRRAKLAVTAAEEAFPTSLPERIPVLGRAFKASQAAYTAFLYRARADVFDQYIEAARAAGVDVNDTAQLQSIGKLVNSLTGRAHMGSLEPGANVVNVLLFSPRMLRANIDVLTFHSLDTSLSGFARKEAAKNLVKIVFVLAIVMAIANALAPDAIEWDPRSSDFGRIKIGDTRFDISGGMRSIITLVSRILTFSSKSSTTGRVAPLNSGKYGSDTGMDVLYRFFENKAAPIPRIAIDVLRGERFDKQKPTFKNELASLATPLIAQNAMEILKQPGGANPLLVVLADAFGVSTNTYTPPPNQPFGRMPIVQRVIGEFQDADAKRTEWRQLADSAGVEPARKYFLEHEREIRSVATADDKLGRVGVLREAHSIIADASRMAREANDSTKQALASVALKAARAALAGARPSRGDARQLDRKAALERDRVTRAMRRSRAPTSPEQQ